MKLNETYIHRVFDISLILKGILSVIEVIGGCVVLWINQQFVLNFVLAFTADELSDDPNDFWANFLVHGAQSFSISSQHFLSFYLLSHGIIKGLLVLALFREKLWSYPLAMVIFSLFGGYQIFEFTRTGSVWLLALTVLDICIIILTWHEYRYMERTGVKPTWQK